MPALLENPSTADRELTLTRIFDAPRALVWKAWTDPTRIMQWMGPQIFTATSCEMEFRPGGFYRVCLHPQDESGDLFFDGVYQEIDEPERLVFTFAWDQEDGSRGHETVVTLVFEDLGDKTKMHFHQGIFQSKEVRDDHEGGWNSCFDRLVQWVQSPASQ